MKRILWLSDIHFDGENQDHETEKLIRAFIQSIRDLGTLDYVIISGDIAISGSKSLHYEQFRLKLYLPLMNELRYARTFCVPGNHDVDWDNVKSEIDVVLKSAFDVEKFAEMFAQKVDKKYYKKAFMAYEEFHEKSAFNKQNSTFTNFVSDGNIVFIFLNSAWLSIGKPVNESHIQQKIINKTVSHEITKTDSKEIVFHELGNQSYGFILPEVRKEINKIGKEITDKYPDHFKILVAHHPPNTWLNWRELYTKDAANRGELHNFILETGIDLILSGHEHTSIVEGGMVFGRSLALQGGMFLDHKQDDYSSCWYKLLEINNEDDPEHLFIDERWFHYSNSKGGIWREQKDFSCRYSGWKKVCKPLNSPETPDMSLKVKPELPKIKSDSELMEYLSMKTDLRPVINEFFTLLEVPSDSNSIPIKIAEGVWELEFRKNDKTQRLFLIDNISDLFVNTQKVNGNFPYLCTLFEKRGALDEDTYVFYTYDFIYDFQNNKPLVDQIITLIGAKFDQFWNKIFRHEEFADMIKSSKFAIRY